MHATLTAALSKLTFGTLFFFAVVAVQAQSSAAAGSDQQDATKQDSVLVKYLGVQDDMVVFNVAYKNPQGLPFTVIIKDEDWTQLYQGTYKEKNFYKQFRFPRADKDKITFVIRNFKDADIAKSFVINVNSRFIQDVAVKKLD